MDVDILSARHFRSKTATERRARASIAAVSPAPPPPIIAIYSSSSDVPFDSGPVRAFALFIMIPPEGIDVDAAIAAACRIKIGKMNGGRCDERFAAVRAAFERNFAKGRNCAAIAVTVAGEPVVDLWGGWLDEAMTRRWARELGRKRVVGWQSGDRRLLAAARGPGIGRHRCARGAVLARFARAGKSAIPVRMLLTIQAGLPAIAKPLPPGINLTSWDTMATELAAQQPWWEPGTGFGYHTNTFGFLVGEVVRRVDGRSLGRFLREEIAEPFGCRFHDWVRTGRRRARRGLGAIPGAAGRRLRATVAGARPRDALRHRTCAGTGVPQPSRPPGSFREYAYLAAGGVPFDEWSQQRSGDCSALWRAREWRQPGWWPVAESRNHCAGDPNRIRRRGSRAQAGQTASGSGFNSAFPVCGRWGRGHDRLGTTATAACSALRTPKIASDSPTFATARAGRGVTRAT